MAPLRALGRVLVVGVLALAASAVTAAPAPSSATPATSASEEDPLQKLAPAVLKVARECLSKEYNAMACWKLFLVRRADGFLGDVKTSENKQTAGTPSFELLPGFVALEKDARRQDNEILDELEDLGGLGGMEAKDDVQGQDLGQDDDAELLDPGRDQESLDRALIARTSKLFAGRHVSVKVLPGVALKLSPRMAKDQSSVDADVSVEVGPGFSVGRMKMKNLSPVFLLPPLMFMGMMPFILATIKGMVVKAMMLNQVAFMSTLWMTVRDVVFGPRPIVKYYNYGYKPHRPPVHFRHPPPPPVHHVEHVEHEEHADHQHHHSEPVHFEHHHEELHLPHHRVEHHVEHHETHGASPFFHDESGTSSEDYAQDLGYIGGADDRNDRDDRRGAHGAHSSSMHSTAKNGQPPRHVDAAAAAADDEDEGGAPSPLPQASPYRRHQAFLPSRLRYSRTAQAA